MTSLTMNNKSKLSPYKILNIVSISKSSIVILQRTCWKKQGVICLEISAVWTKHGFYSMFRKHIVNTFLYTITSFKSSSGRPPRLQNPLRCARNQQPCYFLLSPGPIFPLNTKSFNYVFEYKKIEPGKQKDSVVSTISHLYTRGLIFQVAYTVPMFAKALHCRFFISHYNRKVDIV